ncbi:MAG: hypothetical protein JW993_17050 [Sedimentisphaerales bacterium]|nr:hypothetical protein [Sedimentisphaerales bacterium]
MNTSDKLTWLARLLALIVMGFALSVLGILQRKATGPYTHTIHITADGHPDEIVAAIEQLGRPDVAIDVKETPWYNRTGLLQSTIGITISLGFFLGFYHAVCCALRALLCKLYPDPTLIEPV